MIPWGGVSCCLSAAALYLLGRSSDREAETLKTVTRFNQLRELAKLLDLESQCLPVIVAISGRVGSDAPIMCEQSDLRGVIVHETLEQHFLKLDKSDSWIHDSTSLLSMTREVPWYLYDGTGRVDIVEAHDAKGFALTVRTEAFESDSVRSLERGTLDYLQHIKILGLKSIKRFLPTGTYLTVVGEAIKDDIGSIRIQKPHIGPFMSLTNH